MTARILTWTAVAEAGKPLAVLDGQISVDSTRNPQVSASLTLPHVDYATTKKFDPFKRAPVYLDLALQTFQSGSLADFARTSRGTLATLDWSAKGSTPSLLQPTVPASIKRRRLRLYVTDVNVNETAGTFDVQLASADYLLTELVNYGRDWHAPIFTQSGEVTYSYLNQTWNAFFQTFALPLSCQTASWQGQVTNVVPWRRGDEAWTFLSNVRTAAQLRYVLNTTTGRITFRDYSTPAFASIDRASATSVMARRSVENAFEGLNQYADGVQVRWVDQTDQDRPDNWGATWTGSSSDWRLLRRTYIEDRDMPDVGPIPGGLSTKRFDRMRRFRRITTVTIPHDPIAAPFVDLSEHPLAESVQSIVFDYLSGDVTTTYLEAD